MGGVLSGFDLALPASAFGGRFKVVGRDVFLAFWYRPQALQMVAPCGDLLHSGVLVVWQLLWSVSAPGFFPVSLDCHLPAYLAALAAGGGSRVGPLVYTGIMVLAVANNRRGAQRLRYRGGGRRAPSGVAPLRGGGRRGRAVGIVVVRWRRVTQAGVGLGNHGSASEDGALRPWFGSMALCDCRVRQLAQGHLRASETGEEDRRWVDKMTTPASW